MNDKLKNYATEPDPKVWEGIEKTMRRRAVRRQAWTGAVGAAIVALAVVGVVLWPDGKKDSVAQPALPDVAQVMPREEIAAVSGQQETKVPDVVATQPKVVNAEPAKVARAVEAQPVSMAPSVKAEVPSVAVQPVVAVQAVQPTAVSSPVVVEPRSSAPTVGELQGETVPAVEDNSPAKSVAKSSAGNANEDTILWLPNIFVPSSDDAEINVFRARLNHPGDVLTNYRMTIFSRMGNQVFMSSDVNKGWDGTYRGREMPQSTYVYVIYYTDKDGFRHQRKGTITLVR